MEMNEQWGLNQALVGFNRHRCVLMKARERENQSSSLAFLTAHLPHLCCRAAPTCWVQGPPGRKREDVLVGHLAWILCKLFQGGVAHQMLFVHFLGRTASLQHACNAG